MAQRFPIFIDLGSVAPLVVGADQGLAAKIRLLAGFAPVVDLVTGMDLPPGELRHPQMRHITGVALQAADSLFRGRPLIIIETGNDETMDADTLAAAGLELLVARRYGCALVHFLGRTSG